ncbi:MAG: 3D-(3,5/4)-trihydroxycyclohexane-1,2-dione acylhydrolase (decyclizing) [Hyphomicrobiaceae bacterium]|nr:3D-(3,5/4)-trihydroxycyclohexane-1,2-dione acylhydrolase (decyclizing) [Hyphomicrobiaceae bacterium]
MKTIRLTGAQALVRFLACQMTVVDGEKLPFFAGVWAIFGHGNVAGLGEALWHQRQSLPTWRAHNEQAMAHAAIAFAKASFRRRAMACTTSIGPGATNMITAAAVAHVNRLPVLFIPGDVFAARAPDPVLQQVEDFADGTVSANDCFRPVSRYFDRIQRPEQLINALPQVMRVLTDPADCGPATLAFCQDAQAEAFDYPASLFEERLWTPRRPRPDADELAAAIALIRAARKPLLIAGGGVLYSGAGPALARLVERHGIPVCETQAGKSAVDDASDLAMGAVGVTGTSAANALAAEADLVLAVGTRLADFTTGSWALFRNPRRKLLQLNVSSFDALKHFAATLVCDAAVGLEELSAGLKRWRAPAKWSERARAARRDWEVSATAATRAGNAPLPADAQVIGAVMRAMGPRATVVGAAGGLPGELHKLWTASAPGAYHLEYGYSTMGYEIAGGIGVKLAQPDRDVVVMVGDGSYLMMNSEIATSVMLGLKLVIVVLDNRGFGCINRLQMATGGANFNNLFADVAHVVLPAIDFAAHARALGAEAVKVDGIGELEAAVVRARASARTSVVVIDTDPLASTGAGGHWWDVAVPEVSQRPEVGRVRAGYDFARKAWRL